jgi:hypothetical protein
VPLLSLNYLRYLYLAYFSKPVADRSLFRAIRRLKARKILEVGIESSTRTLRMIHLARRLAGAEAVRYVAIDLFEARASAQGSGQSLKETHKRLSPTGAQVQLIPGEPVHAIPRAANALAGMDLVVISAESTLESLSGAWFYLPRMLHPKSEVYLETPLADGSGTSFRLLAHEEIETLAAASKRRRAA